MDVDDAMKTLSSIKMAREHAACGRHGAATALVMQALQDVPQLGEELEAELTFSLKAYGEHLTSVGQPKNALWLYSQAIPLLPCPRGLHTNLGALQYSLGKAAASVESFQRALALDPGYWPALESLENVKSLAVDRWHFRMLNHSARNEAYSRAIGRAVAAATADRGSSEVGDVTVLDIGTGTGILAVMAARAGASRVFACEVNGVLCDIAREVAERNGVADRVTVIHKSSGALRPGVDLPDRGVDIVVTELVDSGLLGERIIPVLADARARGLLARGGRVIPEGACVYAAVLESETVRRRSRLFPGSPAGLSTETVCPAIEEPYTCEDLGRLEHQLLTSPTPVLEIDFLRDGAALMAPSPPRNLPAPSVPPLFPARVLPVERSGCADAVAIWFDLWLDGERGERDVVSTRPDRCTHGDASGWDAGIYFASGVVVREGGGVRLEASAGRDKLHLTLHGEGECAVDSLTDFSRSEGAVFAGDREGAGDARGHGETCLLGEMDLARLNDGPFHWAHANAVAASLAVQGVDTAAVARPSADSTAPGSPRRRSALNAAAKPVGLSATETSSAVPPPPAFVLDLCGAWGLAGLLVAQLERRDGAPAARVLAIAESEEAAVTLNALARENGLGPDRYVATADSLVDLASRGGGAAAENCGGGSGRGEFKLTRDQNRSEAAGISAAGGWPGRETGLRWAVVMASSLVEGSGLLKQGGLGDLELCRQFVADGGGASEAPPTAVVPGYLEVVCQGLQRASLVSENRVRPDRCCGVDVDPINAFSVTNFRELDLSAAASQEACTGAPEEFGDGGVFEQSYGEKTRRTTGCREEDEAFLTAPIACYDVDLANVRAGPDGCLPRRSTCLRVERDGTLHAVAYWYRQHLGPPPIAAEAAARRREESAVAVLDTGPREHGVGDEGPRSHFRQAAVLLGEPMVVKAGQLVNLCVFCNSSKGVVIEVLGIATEAAGARIGVAGGIIREATH